MRRYHSASEEEDEPMFPADDREWEYFVKPDGSLMTEGEADCHHNWANDDYEYDPDDDDWEHEDQSEWDWALFMDEHG